MHPTWRNCLKVVGMWVSKPSSSQARACGLILGSVTIWMHALSGIPCILWHFLLLMLCSSMLTGHHDATQLPVVMLGGGGGRIKGGRNLDYLGKSDRQMCRLFLSMMDKMDVHPKTFGDATKPLGEV